MRQHLLGVGSLWLLASVLALPACTAGPVPERGLVPAPATSPNPATAAPGLPFPDDRVALGLTEYILPGTATEQRSGGAVDNGTTVELDASGSVSGMEYAVYRFTPGGNAPDSVSVLLEEAATTGTWIGLANYTTLSWDLSGPYTKQKSFIVDDGNHLSPGGSLWVVELSPAGESATVNALSVRTLNPNNVAPTVDLQASVSGGPLPLNVDFDASGSADSDGSIVEYAWDWQGDGLYDSLSDVAQVSHTYNNHGTFNATLRVTDGLPAISFGRDLDPDFSAEFVLCYLQAQDTAGTLWDSQEIDTVHGNPDDVGRFCSLAEINSRAAIAYCDESNGDLRYAINF